MKTKSANGLTGMLIQTWDSMKFRVYNNEHMFTDYDIRHYDLQVTIVDPDAYIYDNKYIDYSPQTLGIENESSN